MKIFAVRVASITNTLLAEYDRRWVAKIFVRETTEERTGGATFEPCSVGRVSCYTDRGRVERLIRKVSRRFQGVTFEVVEFASSEEPS